MIKTVSSWSKKANKCNRTEEWKGHHRYTWKIISLRPGKSPAEGKHSSYQQDRKERQHKCFYYMVDEAYVQTCALY